MQAIMSLNFSHMRLTVTPKTTSTCALAIAVSASSTCVLPSARRGDTWTWAIQVLETAPMILLHSISKPSWQKSYLDSSFHAAGWCFPFGSWCCCWSWVFEHNHLKIYFPNRSGAASIHSPPFSAQGVVGHLNQPRKSKNEITGWQLQLTIQLQ